MGAVPVARGHQCDRLDLAVDPLGGGAGDPVREAGQEIRRMPFQSLGRGEDGRQARVRRPEVPSPEVLRRPRGIPIVPEGAERRLGRPGAADLEVGLLQGIELRPAPRRDPLGAPALQVLGPREAKVVLCLEALCSGRRTLSTAIVT